MLQLKSMAKKHLYITEFGSGLPLIHWAALNPSEFVIHTRNPAIKKYLSSLRLNFTDSWQVSQNAESVFVGRCEKPEIYNQIILSAKQAGIKSHVYFDSWVNYSGRLNTEPTEILVSDPWAMQLAQDTYPNHKIVHFDDFHLQFLARAFSPNIAKSVLFVDSPTNAYNNIPKQIHNLNCVCLQMLKISERFQKEVIFRNHPGYEANECVNILKKNQTVEISINPESLLKDLESAAYVVGPVSYVHYIAENLGIPAFTTFTPNDNWHGPRFRSLNL